MSFLTALAANWRFGLYGLIAATLLIGGFWIKGRLVRAAEADRLEQTLESERKALKAANDARVLLSAQLAENDRAIDAEIREVTRYVPKYIRSDCTLSVDGVRALNQARGVPRPAG